MVMNWFLRTRDSTKHAKRCRYYSLACLSHRYSKHCVSDRMGYKRMATKCGNDMVIILERMLGSSCYSDTLLKEMFKCTGSLLKSLVKNQKVVWKRTSFDSYFWSSFSSAEGDVFRVILEGWLLII